MANEYENYIKKLNKAHRGRFLNLNVDQIVKIEDFEGNSVEGRIETINSDYIIVNNDAPTAGGMNQTVNISWAEIIKLQQIG